jgi:hypothetical protein
MKNQVHDAIRDTCSALNIELCTYSVRLSVTTRAYHEIEIDAVDDEQAFNLVQQIDMRDYAWAFEDAGIDGDEIAYILGNEDQELEIELDLRSKGEPFSWVACAIVKQLAVATSDEERQRLVVCARDACTTARDREEPINNADT